MALIKDRVLAITPSTYDCLAWSKDAILAAATINGIELTIPATKLSDRGMHDMFHSLIVRTDRFSEEELPWRPPTTNDAFSIGEEQSTRHVIAIAWSHIGLVEHRRYVLAVLTSNHILSLWAPTGILITSPSWNRALIVNKHLQEYRANYESADEEKRARNRIRCFAWSHSLQQASAAFQEERQYLAVGLDNGDVGIHSVHPPVSKSEEEEGWSSPCVETLSHLSAPANDENALSVFLNGLGVQNKQYISHLAWSPWVSIDGGILESYIATIIGGSLTFSRLTIDGSLKLDFRRIQGFDDGQTHFDGPLRWVQTNELLFLLACSRMGIFCFEVPPETDKITKITVNPLDRTWDPVTGMTIVQSPSGSSAEAHIILQFSNTQSTTSVLSIPGEPGAKIATPAWSRYMQMRQQRFNAANKLDGHATCKAFGITAVDDVFALAFSYHPTDMVEYAMPSTAKTHIAMFHGSTATTTDEEVSRTQRRYSMERVASEVLAFLWYKFRSEEAQSKRRKKRGSEKEKDIRPKAKKDTVQALASLGYTFDEEAAEDTGQSMIAVSAAHDQYATALRWIIYGPSLDRQRIGLLLSTLNEDETLAAERSIAIALTRCVQMLPESVRSDDASSRRISTALMRASRLISANDEDSIEEFSSGDSTDSINEQCILCGTPIPFTDLRGDRCRGEGIFWKRCQLTYLCIQEPRSWKSCGICERQYFKHDALCEGAAPASALYGPPEQVAAAAAPPIGNTAQSDGADGTTQGVPNGNVLDHSARHALVDILWAACDHCIYCGGKFIG